MKKISYSVLIIVQVVALFFLFSQVNNMYREGNIPIKMQAPSSEPIHIIGNQGWENFKTDGNCTGQGTSEDPFVIASLTIDGMNIGNCICIQDSNVFFRIEECILFGSNRGTFPDFNAGIK